METPANAIEALFERIETYIKTTYQLSKLRLLDTTTRILSSLILRLTVVLTLSLFTVILSIGVALYLGDVLGKSYYGFFIVSGFYLLVGLILHFFLHKQIKKSVCDLIIKETLK